MRLVFASRPPDATACARWSGAPTTSSSDGPSGATVDHYEAPVQLGPGETPFAAFVRVRDRLLAYDVFPPVVVRATICPDGRITVGATIVQHVAVGPLALEAAVRVIEVWDRAGPDGGSAAGFRYVTLRGHPECGVASFEVRATPAGEVRVLLGARSRPGTWQTRLGRPFARLLQRTLTRAALRRLTTAPQR